MAHGRTAEQALAIHEAVCSQRYKELNADVNELKESVKTLVQLVSAGKGGVRVLYMLGGVITAVLGGIWAFIQIFKEIN